MNKHLSFEQAAQYGFIFPGARAWYNANRTHLLARDAAMVTTPSTTVPLELLAYIDPEVIDIMTAPRRAREIYTEVRKGDWSTPVYKKRIDEIVGRSQAYSDFSHNGVAEVNSEWRAREQYIFQTVIDYGDLEADMAGAAKINLAAAKQRAAATILDIDGNAFYLLGVRGKEIYGILNDPNLPVALAAAPTGTGDSTFWADKSTRQRYDDILNLFGELCRKSAGLIDRNTPLVLALSPEMEVMLGSATDFNVNCLDMLTKYFANLKIVSLPELSNQQSGETMLMIAPNVAGTDTGDLAFGVKIRAGRIVTELSSLKQKYVSSTYGGAVFIPFAFAQMTGM